MSGSRQDDPRHGLHVLLHPFCFCRYLQEIGYTDTIIDVRSNRVRSLLGLHDNLGGGDANEDSNSNRSSSNAVNGDANDTAGRYSDSGTTRRGPATLGEEMAIDNEAAVMANFDFLNEGPGMEDDDDMEEGLAGSSEDLKLSNVGTTSSSGKHDIDVSNCDDCVHCFDFFLKATAAGNAQSSEDNVDGSGKAVSDSRRGDESSDWGKCLFSPVSIVFYHVIDRYFTFFHQ